LDVSALNIRTAPDLVFVPPADPELLWELPTGTITFPDLTNHIAHVRNAVAGPALTGDRLSGGLEARVQLLSVPSGLPALDELVAVVGNRFGGASVGRIVEISGANGWSQIPALHIILHHIESHPADAALWLDTTGHLAPVGLAMIASRSVRYETPYVLCIAGGQSTLLVSSGKGQVRSGSASPRGKRRRKGERGKGKEREIVCV